MADNKAQTEYNRLYEQLVCNADDDFDRMAGMLAYGEYKWEKNRFFARYYQEYKAKPDSEAVKNFMLKYKDESTINELLDSGRNTLYSFADAYLLSKKENMLKELQGDEVIRAVKNNTAWWKGFLLSISAAFTYSLILAGLVLSITLLNPDSQIANIFRSLLK